MIPSLQDQWNLPHGDESMGCDDKVLTGRQSLPFALFPVNNASHISLYTSTPLYLYFLYIWCPYSLIYLFPSLHRSPTTSLFNFIENWKIVYFPVSIWIKENFGSADCAWVAVQAAVNSTQATIASSKETGAFFMCIFLIHLISIWKTVTRDRPRLLNLAW